MFDSCQIAWEWLSGKRNVRRKMFQDPRKIILISEYWQFCLTLLQTRPLSKVICQYKTNDNCHIWELPNSLGLAILEEFFKNKIRNIILQIFSYVHILQTVFLNIKRRYPLERLKNVQNHTCYKIYNWHSNFAFVFLNVQILPK